MAASNSEETLFRVRNLPALRRLVVNQLETLNQYFIQHYACTLKVRILITTEGHVALHYTVRRDLTEETICGEASFDDPLLIRETVRHHITFLINNFEKDAFEPCVKCGKRHRLVLCPRNTIPRNIPCRIVPEQKPKVTTS